MISSGMKEFVATALITALLRSDFLQRFEG